MQRRRVAGLSAVTAILKMAEPRVGMTILDNLDRHDHALMERLAPGQIDFADLMELDDHTLATTIAAADPEIVLLALVGVAARVARPAARARAAAGSQAGPTSPGPFRPGPIERRG